METNKVLSLCCPVVFVRLITELSDWILFYELREMCHHEKYYYVVIN